MISTCKGIDIIPIKNFYRGDEVELIIQKRDPDTFKRYALVITDSNWKEVKEGTIAPDFGVLSDTNTQALMDRLWACGFRPTEGRGSAGALAATQEHLKDIQKIANRLLDEICPATKPNS